MQNTYWKKNFSFLHIYTPHIAALCVEKWKEEWGMLCLGLRWQQSCRTARAPGWDRDRRNKHCTRIWSFHSFWSKNSFVYFTKKHTDVIPKRGKKCFPSRVYQNHFQCHSSAMDLSHPPQLPVHEQSGAPCLTRAGRSQHLSCSAPTLLHKIFRDCSWNWGGKKESLVRK